MAVFGPKASSRVIINRQALSAFETGVADGLAYWAQETLADAKRRAPFDESDPTGRHMRDTGGWSVLYGSRKVAGDANKPRGVRTKAGTITALVGFGSPIAHLLERGTALRATENPDRRTGRGPALPFLLPALVAGSGRVVGDIRRFVASRTRR